MKPTNNIIKDITDITGRSLGQTEKLLQLLDNDYKALAKLEIAIKNNHIAYCPDILEEIFEIIAMKPKTYWYTALNDFLNEQTVSV